MRNLTWPKNRIAFSFLLSSTFVFSMGAAPKNGAHVPQTAQTREVEMQELNQRLRNRVRLQARSGAPITVSEIESNYLEPLIAGLKAPSESAQREALRGLSLISTATLWRESNPAATIYAPLRTTLQGLFRSPDPEMRVGAAATYVSLFGMSVDAEGLLMGAFSETQSAEVKETVLRSLLVKGSSPDAERFVIEQIDDPRFGYDAAMAILRKKPPPLGALPRIVARFGNSTDAGNRDLVARAFQQYGEAALPYLAMMKQLQINEQNQTVKQNLARAIELIEHPTSAAAAPVRARPSGAPTLPTTVVSNPSMIAEGSPVVTSTPVLPIAQTALSWRWITGIVAAAVGVVVTVVFALRNRT